MQSKLPLMLDLAANQEIKHEFQTLPARVGEVSFLIGATRLRNASCIVYLVYFVVAPLLWHFDSVIKHLFRQAFALQVLPVLILPGLISLLSLIYSLRIFYPAWSRQFER